MQTRDFCFWLQGLLEVGKIETLDAEQVALIKAHLDLVFKHDVTIKTKEMEHPAKPVLHHEWQVYKDTSAGAPDFGRVIATC